MDGRGVADGAVASSPADADVVVLAAQVGLVILYRGGACVPVETGYFAFFKKYISTFLCEHLSIFRCEASL